MFGFGKKKEKEPEEKILSKDEKEDRLKRSLRKELEKEQKRNKEKGSKWISVVVLIISMLAGVFFWVYGKLSGGGFAGADFDSFEFSKPESRPASDNGMIIFEK